MNFYEDLKIWKKRNIYDAFCRAETSARKGQPFVICALAIASAHQETKKLHLIYSPRTVVNNVKCSVNFLEKELI